MIEQRAVAWPDDNEALGLYRQLVVGTPMASSDLCKVFLEPLIGAMLRANPRVDPHLCEEAAGSALLALIARPETYDERRASLAAYLRRSAQGDLINLLRREARHTRGRVPFQAVELGLAGGNVGQDDAEDRAEMQAHEVAWRARADRIFEQVRLGLPPPEQAVLDLMRGGERRTAPYASALGILHLPVDARRRQVKRVKDKIIKRIERAGTRDAATAGDGPHVP